MSIKQWHEYCINTARNIVVKGGKICGLQKDYNTETMNKVINNGRRM